MKGIEKIIWKENTLAIIIRNDVKVNGTNNFLSEKNYPLQIAVHKCEKGHIFKPHKHRAFERMIKITQEVLFIKNGKILVDFYNEKSEKIAERILNGGDVVFFIGGGHGIKVLEESEIFEVKQGPYINKETDKEFI